ncbi:hypothetical protein C8R44DRAFT_811096 [Mycena epipterygia]|nr:hypothetical protein C8R44DRAFT_811096 [Mycena epipterygia]
MSSDDAWSRLPFELAHEITAHNSDQFRTLKAMALVSKTMRSSAIVHLFAALKFSCPEDLHTWLDIVGRTPELGTRIVRSVKFSWNYAMGRAPDARRAPDPSSIPYMPNVQAVIWESSDVEDIAMAGPRLSLFPNMTELCLSGHFRDFESLSKMLGACRRLKILSLMETTVGEDGRIDKSRSHLGLFDLTALEKLEIHCIDPANYIADLLDHSTPLELRSLAPGNPISCDVPCSIAVMNKVLRLGASSLEKLVVDPGFGSQQVEGLDMFERLPPLTALKSFTLWLTPSSEAETLINAWPAAPNVTDITFRIQFHEDTTDELGLDLQLFRDILENTFTWKTGEAPLSEKVSSI